MKESIERPKRQKKPKEGDVIAIPLGDGTFGFGQVCRFNCYAYFDLRSEAIEATDFIVSRPILFRVITAQDAVKTGGWIIVGHHDLKDGLAERVSFWSQSIGSNEVTIYKDGTFVPATPEQVKGLENMACWYSQHIVERLIDHFSGRLSGIASRVNRIRVYDPQTARETDLPAK